MNSLGKASFQSFNLFDGQFMGFLDSFRLKFLEEVADIEILNCQDFLLFIICGKESNDQPVVNVEYFGVVVELMAGPCYKIEFAESLLEIWVG